MELSSTFTVSQPVDRAWQVITDLERVVPCLPGAALLGIDGDDHRGAVEVTVGPVTAQYEGIARFAERDDAAHHAVLRAEGRDVRGQGTAAATVDLTLTGRGSGTQVTIGTDLELAGRVAQFGRGVIADVSGKLIGQFATRLEEEMATSWSPAAAPSASATAPAPDPVPPARRSIDDVEPPDLMSVGSGTALTQAVPVATALLGLLLGVLLGRRGRAGGAAPLVLDLVLPGNDPEGGLR